MLPVSPGSPPSPAGFGKPPAKLMATGAKTRDHGSRVIAEQRTWGEKENPSVYRGALWWSEGRTGAQNGRTGTQNRNTEQEHRTAEREHRTGTQNGNTEQERRTGTQNGNTTGIQNGNTEPHADCSRKTTSRLGSKPLTSGAEGPPGPPH